LTPAGSAPHRPPSCPQRGWGQEESKPRGGLLQRYQSTSRLPGSRGEPESRRPARSFSRGVLSTWAAFRDRLALSRDSLEGSAEAWVRDLSLSAPGKRDLVKECRDRRRIRRAPPANTPKVTLVQSHELQIFPAAVHSPTFALKKRMAPNTSGNRAFAVSVRSTVGLADASQ
jgi:hypothetical protein